MPARYLMALGNYRFSLDTAAYQSLTRSTEYRWQPQDRLGRRPAHQYLGPGQDEINLEGTIYPEYRGGLGQLDRMREEANAGKPLLMTDSTGRVWGRWVIRRVEETQRVFSVAGTPRKVEFRLQLSHYGEDA